MPEVKPKKALGQHFLTDERVADRIASTLDAYKGMPVLEIGPGMGVLSKWLLEKGHDLTVVEIDDESVGYLKHNFNALTAPRAAQGSSPALSCRIVEGDFLQLDLKKIYGDEKFCVIGNYPYNISSQIFFKILDYKDQIPCCSGMLQKEVAERLAAKEGGRTRGILSVLLQVWYDIEYLFTVSEGVFCPPPKVKSGVIRLIRNDRKDLPCDERLLRTVVKTTFGQRRKTIRNSIKSLLPPGAPMPESSILTLRPEQLSVEQFFQLTSIIAQARAMA